MKPRWTGGPTFQPGHIFSGTYIALIPQPKSLPSATLYQEQELVGGLFLKYLPKNSILLGNVLDAAPVVEDLIHLFQSLAVGFRDREPNPDEREQTKHGKEYICAKSRLTNQWRRDKANNKIIDPV